MLSPKSPISSPNTAHLPTHSHFLALVFPFKGHLKGFAFVRAVAKLVLDHLLLQELHSED